MKYRQLILSMTVALILGEPVTAGARTASWGYVHHASVLSKEYLEKTVPGYDVIAVTGFRFTNAGGIAVTGDALLKRISLITKKNSSLIYPLISFVSAAQGHRILNSPALLRKSARRVGSLASEHGFRGVHLDFEYLPPADSRKIFEFLGILRSCYSGKITMAIFPQIDFPAKWSGLHDLQLLASRVDEIVIMCYDLHASHTGPGPVTSPEWAEKNVAHALKYMAPGRIWLGIPAYGYRWGGGKAAPLTAAQCSRLARLHGARRDSSGNMNIQYKKSGETFHVYYSDRETRLLLTKLAARYGLAGTALWRIGFED